MKSWLPVALSLAISLGIWTIPVQADDSTFDVDPPEGLPLHSIETIKQLDDGDGAAYGIEAEYHHGNNKFDQAILNAKAAMERNPDDLEYHLTYAEAIEDKLDSQKNKDQHLYCECLKQWLIVLRNEVGEEKGLTVKGISIFGHINEDDTRGRLARLRISQISGIVPKPFETDEAFIRKAMRRIAVRTDVMAAEHPEYSMSKP